jgi:hypothetical protein
VSRLESRVLMPIGGADRAARLDQARTLARVQVFAGDRANEMVLADVLAAVATEVKDTDEARRLADEYVDEARQTLDRESKTWPVPSDYDRLQSALAEFESTGFVVLRSCDDHWEVESRLRALRAADREPRAAAFYTETDVWHAIEEGMLELNIWHGSSANLMTGDPLLDESIATLARHGLNATFDEGRLEVTMTWQRRP